MSSLTEDYVFEFPPSMQVKLRAVGKRMTKVGAVTAVVLALAVLLTSMILAMLVDYFAVLYDSPWRFALTGSALAVAGLTFAIWLFWEWNKTRRLARLASEVDRSLPELEERWSTVAQCALGDIDPITSHPAMLNKVAREAEKSIPRVNPTEVVHLARLAQALMVLCLIVLVLAMSILFDWRRSLVLMRRFWAPGADISMTRVIADPGNTVAARGEPLTLSGRLQGLSVDEASLFLRQSDGTPHTLTLLPNEEQEPIVSHKMKSVTDPFTYRIRAGDGQTVWHTVDVADPPQIDVISLSITPPEYRREQEVKLDKLPRQCSAVVGSRLELALQSKDEVASVKLQLGEKEEVLLIADQDGWYRWQTELTKSFSVSPVLTESHGLTNRRPPTMQVDVFPDSPPEVRILSPDDQIAVSPDETVTIEFVAEDDNGISAAELVVTKESSQPGGKPEELMAMPIPLGDHAGDKKIEGQATFDLSQFVLDDGAALSYQIRVREERSTNPGAQRGQSAPAEATVSKDKSTSGTTLADNSASDDSDRNNESIGTESADTTSQQIAQLSNDPNNRSPNSTAGKNQITANQTKTVKGERQPAAANDGDQKNESTETESKDPASPQDAQPTDDPDNQSSDSIAKNKATSNQMKAVEGASRRATDLPTVKSLPANKKTITDKQANDKSPTNTLTPDGERKTPGDRSVSPDSDPAKQDDATTDRTPGKSSPQDKSTGKPSAPAMLKPKDPTPTDPKDLSSGASSKKSPEMPKEQPKQASDTNRLQIGPRKEKSPASPSMPAGQKDSSPQKKNDSQQGPAEPREGADPSKPSKPERETDQNDAAKSDEENKEPNTANGGKGPKQGDPSEPKGGQGGQKGPKSPGKKEPAPGNNMTTRSLDVPQSAASKEMRIKVDKWAGSFAGQQRAKLEIAVAPVLAEVREHLLRAQKLSNNVLTDLKGGKAWEGRHQRDVTAAEGAVKQAQTAATELHKRTQETPYTFIGLQLIDISEANMIPARREFLKSFQSEGEPRSEAVRMGWNHVGQAIDRLDDLTRRFETARREHALADKTQQVKQMYRIFVEDAFALLGRKPEEQNNKHQRKIAELTMDDEYLARLKEVLEMRHKLRAELARILAEDPRLRRRFVNSFSEEADSVRKQVSKLRERQEAITNDTLVWINAEAENRDEALHILKRRRLEEAAQIGLAAGRMADRFESWVPIAKTDADSELGKMNAEVQALATSARELGLSAIKARAKATDSKQLDKLNEDARSFIGQLEHFESALQQLDTTNLAERSESFKVNRLVETRGLIATTKSWTHRIKHLGNGDFHKVAAVEQNQLAVETDQVADKLANSIELELNILPEAADSTAIDEIIKKSRALVELLDQQATPNQQGAAIALQKSQLPRAQDRQQAALATLTTAENQLDEVMAKLIEELDKEPIQDPIAALLQDPTLDEILRQLEQELVPVERLGIPKRRSNLQIIGDWPVPDPNDENAVQQNAQMLAQMLQQEQQRMMRAAEAAFNQAMARLDNEAAVVTSEKAKDAEVGRSSRWNSLISELEDDLLQSRNKLPPEQFRTAIEQYYEIINSEVSKEKASSKEKKKR